MGAGPPVAPTRDMVNRRRSLWAGPAVALGIGLLLPRLAWAELVQKKYPGIEGRPTDEVMVANQRVRLVPAVPAQRPSTLNFRPISDSLDLPYLIVRDEDYQAELAKRVGYYMKPENHVRVRGRETVVLKASEVESRASYLPVLSAISTSPLVENHVTIDGIHTVFVASSHYLPFIARYPGLADLPANYVMIDGEVAQVVPMDSEARGFPRPLLVAPSSEVRIKQEWPSGLLTGTPRTHRIYSGLGF